jgi:branched-subunit amino acid transport protein AzlD
VLSLREALVYTFAMGLVIFFCRALPFVLFRNREDSPRAGGGRDSFSRFVERTAPQAAMTALACNALARPLGEYFFQGEPARGIPLFAAAAFTALAYLWKRNPFLSIFGGAALCALLTRLFP